MHKLFKNKKSTSSSTKEYSSFCSKTEFSHNLGLPPRHLIRREEEFQRDNEYEGREKSSTKSTARNRHEEPEQEGFASLRNVDQKRLKSSTTKKHGSNTSYSTLPSSDPSKYNGMSLSPVTSYSQRRGEQGHLFSLMNVDQKTRSNSSSHTLVAPAIPSHLRERDDSKAEKVGSPSKQKPVSTAWSKRNESLTVDTATDPHVTKKLEVKKRDQRRDEHTTETSSSSKELKSLRVDKERIRKEQKKEGERREYNPVASTRYTKKDPPIAAESKSNPSSNQKEKKENKPTVPTKYTRRESSPPRPPRGATTTSTTSTLKRDSTPITAITSSLKRDSNPFALNRHESKDQESPSSSRSHQEQPLVSVFKSTYDREMASRQTRMNTLSGKEREEQDVWVRRQLILNKSRCPGGWAFRRIEVPIHGYACAADAHFVSDELLAEGRGGYYYRAAGSPFRQEGSEKYIARQELEGPLYTDHHTGVKRNAVRVTNPRWAGSGYEDGWRFF